MCRWLAYTGCPQLLYNLLFDMKHNLIVQSKHSTMGAEALNGDGFGIGWYPNNNNSNNDKDPDDDDKNSDELTPSTPFLFRSVEPAWHDKNLKELSGFVVSPTVFVHIRAASLTGSGV